MVGGGGLVVGAVGVEPGRIDQTMSSATAIQRHLDLGAIYMWDDILLYVIIGFVAQMIDGAIGMAYGVTASSVLLSLGVPPATASACVHAAETFTTGASGFAHWRLGNVDRKLLVRLAVPGMIGGAIGAYVLSELPGDTLRPLSALTSFCLGYLSSGKRLRPVPSRRPLRGQSLR